MDYLVTLFLAVPLVFCPISSVHKTEGSADYTSITNHITALEHKVTILQLQYELELKSTLEELAEVRQKLEESMEVNEALRNDLASKCRILNEKSEEFNVRSLKSRFIILKNEVTELKSSCVASKQSISNITELIDAVSTSLSYEVQLTCTQTSVQVKATLLFDKVRTNTGGHYNVSTGVFTAPVNGSYVIWASLHLRQPNTFINVYAHSERNLIGYGHAETGNDSSGGVANLMGVTYLVAGNRVWFTKGSGPADIHGGQGQVSSRYGGALLRHH